MTVTGWDWSWGHPSAQAIAAHGFKVCLRYYAPERDGKNLTPAEAWGLCDAGLYLGTVYEHGAACVGAEAGAEAGQIARRQADACGQPFQSVIYLAEDFDVPQSLYNGVAAALDSFRQATGRWVGVYGKADLCRAMLTGGHARAAWQTAAWSGGVVLPNAAIFQTVQQAQITGVTGDIDDIRSPFAGLWRLDRAQPAVPAPEVPPVFSPPLQLSPIVDQLSCPSGGVWLLGQDGGVYAFGGAPFFGSASGQGYFGGRQAAALVTPTADEQTAGRRYVVVDTTGKRYAYPE